MQDFKMRVLYVERSLSNTGLVYDQIRRLKKYVDANILAVQVGKSPYLEEDNVVNVRCSFIPKIEMLKGWAFKTCALRGFNRIKQTGRFDLIHTHFAYPEGLAAFKISRQEGIPYIITGRGDDILLYPKYNRYLRNTISMTLKNCAGFIGVSKDIVEKGIELGAPAEYSIFQPNGIPEDIFNCENADDAKSDDCKTVLFAGSLLPVKNIMLMIEAFLLICSQNSNVIFRIAGEGILRNDIIKRIRESGFYDRFELPGQLSPVSLACEMKKADVLCLPSISEGWPNVVMEAMACGTPVVGANIGGIPEQIISDDYGYLCSPYSPEDIAMKLTDALNKNWDHEKLKKRGQMYTRDNAASRIVEFYRSTLNRVYEPRTSSCAE